MSADQDPVPGLVAMGLGRVGVGTGQSVLITASQELLPAKVKIKVTLSPSFLPKL